MKRSILTYVLMLALSLTLLGGYTTTTHASQGKAESKTEAADDQADAKKDAKEDSKEDAAEEGSTEEKPHEKMTAKELLADLDYDPAKYAKLPNNYDKLKIAVEGDYNYSEEKFKDMINQSLASMTSYEPTDKKTVEDGDAVNIDYEGKIKGKTFEGGSAEGYDLVIGSGSFIEGFEDGLIGKKVGETVELKLTFPKDYSEELAGKDVVFTVKINAINKVVTMTYDTLTDEYVKENLSYYGYSTKKDYLKGEEERYKQDLENQKKQAVVTAYIEELYKKTDFSGMPKEAIDKETEKRMAELEEAAKQNGSKLEDYLKSGGYTEESYKEAIEKNYKQMTMLQTMIKDTNFELDKTEAEEQIQYALMYSGQDEETFYKQYGGKEELYRQIAYSQILEEKAEGLEKSGNVSFAGAKTNTNFNLKQTIFAVAGLILLVAAVTLALLFKSGNNKASEENQDQTDSKNDLENKDEKEEKTETEETAENSPVAQAAEEAENDPAAETNAEADSAAENASEAEEDPAAENDSENTAEKTAETEETEA